MAVATVRSPDVATWFWFFWVPSMARYSKQTEGWLVAMASLCTFFLFVHLNPMNWLLMWTWAKWFDRSLKELEFPLLVYSVPWEKWFESEAKRACAAEERVFIWVLAPVSNESPPLFNAAPESNGKPHTKEGAVFPFQLSSPGRKYSVVFWLKYEIDRKSTNCHS